MALLQLILITPLIHSNSILVIHRLVRQLIPDLHLNNSHLNSSNIDLLLPVMHLNTRVISRIAKMLKRWRFVSCFVSQSCYLFI
jgi:hypothetical protein